MKRMFCLFLSVLICIAPLSSLVACDAAASDGRSDDRSDIAPADLMDTVTAALIAANPASDGYVSAGDHFITPSLWGDDAARIADVAPDYAVCLSARADMNIDEVGIFRVRENTSPEVVAAMAEAYLQAQSLRYRDLLAAYNPAELPKSRNGHVLICGRYVMYTLLGDAEQKTAERALRERVCGA